MSEFRNSSSRLPIFVATIVGLFAAAAIGPLSGNPRTFGMLFGGSAIVAIVLWMRTSIWMLVPIFWLAVGRIGVIPLPLSVRDLTVLAAFCSLLIFFAFKLVRVRPRWGWTELLLGINVVIVLLAFIRNPVGVYWMQSDRIAGRPYFDVLIALLAYFVLSRVRLTEKQTKMLPLSMIGVAFGMSALLIVTLFVPALVPILMPIYSGVNVSAFAQGGAVSDKGTGRLTDLQYMGRAGIAGICSYFRPLSLLIPIHFVRFILFVLVMLAILLSGFRSILLYAIAMFLLGSYFRYGMQDVLRSMILMGVAMFFLIAGNGTVYDLPLSAQRTLSWLPGQWDPRALDEAEASSDWRFAMWKDALGSNQFIKDKILGDGFGYSRRDLELIIVSAMSGTQFGGAQYEMQMVQGAFHSGPLSAIRFVGIAGLIPFLVWLVYLATRAAATIRRSRGTPAFHLALFVGMPIIYEPFQYVVVFGGYEGALPTSIFWAGMLKLLGHYLDTLDVKSPKNFLSSRVGESPLGSPNGRLAPAQGAFAVHLASKQ